MIDTHAHLHLINDSIDSVLNDANAAGVQHIVQVAIDEASIDLNLSVYSSLSNCSITGGIHPLSVESASGIDSVIKKLSAHMDAFVAVGEIGLDYKYATNTSLQHDYFIAQMECAMQFNKPVIIHSRHCDDDMLQIVNQFPSLPKVFHCYATNLEFYQSLHGEHNYVSFTGLITHSKRGKVMHAMRSIPLNRIMIETDAPYLRPVGVTDGQNRPEHVGAVAWHIAEHRGVSFQTVVEQTTRNAQLFFDLPLSVTSAC
jgi:TatD DNase family protein